MDFKKNNKDQGKVLKMPLKSKISDAEITSLFLGLCRIIKQQAIDDAKRLIDDEREKCALLCKEIVKKNRDIEMLKMINYQLKKKIDRYFVDSIKINTNENGLN